MKQFTVLAVLMLVVIPSIAIAAPCDERPAWCSLQGSYYGYPAHGYPVDWAAQIIQVSGDGVGRVLDAISSTDKREKFAERWFQILEKSCTESWNFRQQWLGLQNRHLEFQRDTEHLKMEKLRLQAEIERLQTEKLRLEKEKLELQLKLQEATGKQGLSSSTQKPAD